MRSEFIFCVFPHLTPQILWYSRFTGICCLGSWPLFIHRHSLWSCLSGLVWVIFPLFEESTLVFGLCRDICWDIGGNKINTGDYNIFGNVDGVHVLLTTQWWHFGDEWQKLEVWENALTVDHINRDRTDNRARNLRLVAVWIQIFNQTSMKRGNW